MNKIDFKHAGLEFVAGDKFSSGIGSPTIVEEFAWRTNTGVKPEFDGDMDILWSDGSSTIRACLPPHFDLDMPLPSRVKKWRPHLTKVEGKPKSPYDVDAHVSEAKPVFTQAMADAGELPPVGSYAEISESTDYLAVPYESGKRVKIYAHFTSNNGSELAAFVSDDNQCAGVAIGECLKPIQTEREVAIEYAFSKMFPGDAAIGGAEQVLGIAFDCGLLQTPKNNVT